MAENALPQRPSTDKPYNWGYAAALYVTLLLSAVVALWAQHLPSGDVVRTVAPYLFLGFAVGFAIYRAVLVRAKRYSVAKAFIQVSMALLLAALLFSGKAETFVGLKRLGSTTNLVELLKDRNPNVRRLAAEVARYRDDGQSAAKGLVDLLDDPDEGVREEAHTTLVVINNGVDLGAAGNAAAKKSWKEQFR